jgi:hypothetical protein
LIRLPDATANTKVDTKITFGRQLERLRREAAGDPFSISGQLRLLSEEKPTRIAPAAPLSTTPLPEGEERVTPQGRHYRMHRSYPAGYVHGNVRLDSASMDSIARLLELSRSGVARPTSLDRMVFLDTETTGISGGAGMCPFLIGIGFFSGEGFEVEQYLIRDFDEEPSMLEAFVERMKAFDVLVSYNGQSFDAPLVETRSILARVCPPFAHMGHFDLLFMARRLWREGHGSCRLTALEREILGFDRGPDIPGALIPQAYFHYLRSSSALGLRSVISHHLHDIVSLAALTIEAARRVVSPPSIFAFPKDQYSLGRLFDAARETGPGRLFYERAIEGGLPPELEVRAMERLSLLYRRTGEYLRSMEMCEQLMGRGDFSAVGYEGAAILQEHHLGDLGQASSITRDALDRVGPPGNGSRQADQFSMRLERLERKRQKELFREAGD